MIKWLKGLFPSKKHKVFSEQQKEQMQQALNRLPAPPARPVYTAPRVPARSTPTSPARRPVSELPAYDPLNPLHNPALFMALDAYHTEPAKHSESVVDNTLSPSNDNSYSSHSSDSGSSYSSSSSYDSGSSSSSDSGSGGGGCD